MGESSKPTMESTETSAMPEATTVGTSPISNFDQYSKLLTPIPSRVIGYPVAGKAVTCCSSSDAVVLASVMAGFSMGSVSDVEVTLGLGNCDYGFTDIMVGSSTTTAVVIQNRFSPLPDLGNGVEDEFVEGEDHGKD